MNDQIVSARRVLLPVIIAAGLSCCGEKANVSEAAPKPMRPGGAAGSRAGDEPRHIPWNSDGGGGEDTREWIRNSSASPGKRLVVARDAIKSMTGQEAKAARAILTDMVSRDLLANAETADDGEMIITITASDLQVVQQAYHHLARIAPREAALVLGEIPVEVGEEVLGRWLIEETEVDEQALREFQSGLDHDLASALPWRLAREWAAAYGEEAALGHLERISGFLPSSPADMLARMRNSLAAGQ